MAYRTVDEVSHFDFQDAGISEIRLEKGHIYFELTAVTILPENSANRDIRKMGAPELTLQIQQVRIMKLIQEGYQVYDADGEPKASYPDVEIPAGDYEEVLKEIGAAGEESASQDMSLPELGIALEPQDMDGSAVYALQRTETGDEEYPYEYDMYLDGTEHTYHLVMRGKHDVEEWERFMNRESSY